MCQYKKCHINHRDFLKAIGGAFGAAVSALTCRSGTQVVEITAVPLATKPAAAK